VEDVAGFLGMFILVHVVGAVAFCATYALTGNQLRDLRTAFRLGRRVERINPRRRN
jgi:hypothetical protein